MMKHFALVGAAGFVAPRHLKAIRDTGNTLAAALDPHDSVGLLDNYFPEARFFTSFERFERHLEKLRYQDSEPRVEYVSVCSPNFLHDTHIRMALHVDADAICEKPLVINEWNLKSLQEVEAKTGRKVYTVLQLRLLPTLIALKQQLDARPAGSKLDVVLTYITRRGQWYHTSWKGEEEKSGGLAMNIGIHFFDLVLWLFGGAEHSEVHLSQPDKMAGLLELERARVRWYLSVDAQDLPAATREAGKFAFRSITMDGQEMEFSEGFTDLHTRVYEQVLAGNGFGIEAARPSIELVHGIRTAELNPKTANLHPKLTLGR
ncbi:MAG TPA: Gfo/Idh/MocA family oxidoreductase [Phototrophicaceae bacterium]|nr:Gfo/Idh/MocA family oxidoreductase [Phototrophicaceae bacterium]